MNNVRKETFLQEDYFVCARENMVLRHLIPFGITNPNLLKSFFNVPRELFLDESQQETAYSDIFKGTALRGSMLPPHFLGRLLQEAPLDGRGKALVIGGGSGYSAALLSGVMSVVFLLENHKSLVKKANDLMNELGIDNVFAMDGPLDQGLPRQGTFDVMLIEGAVEEIPVSLLEQIAYDGVLLTFLSKNPFMKEAVALKKTRSGWVEKSVFDGNAPVLQAFSKQKNFDL
jgi:protein-L-isoaspartate(D-aspartate) O-methyltransferase